MNNSKTILTSIITSVIVVGVVLLGAWLVGNQSADGTLGALGITRFPNSGIAAQYLKLSSTPGTATAGSAGTLTVSGATTLSGTTTLTGETTLGNCATKTWDPGSIATSTLAQATTTDIA